MLSELGLEWGFTINRLVIGATISAILFQVIVLAFLPIEQRFLFYLLCVPLVILWLPIKDKKSDKKIPKESTK